MFNHAPADYRCPFCALAAGLSCKGLHSTSDDIVCRDNLAVAFVASHWWEKNPGHVLVMPTRHFENLYDLPDEVGAAIFAMSRRVAVAIRQSYGCEGVSTRQHNEPAGYQDVWHYHQHVFPRYADDRLYAADGQSRLTSPAERLPFASKLRARLAQYDESLMLIRDAKLDDAHRIAVIHVDSWRAAYRGIMPDALLDGLSVDDRHRVWTQNLSAAQSQTLVVESQFEIIGWASIGPCRDAEAQGLAEIYGIYLDPAHYRKGFGKSIWSEAVRRLNAMGYHELVVWVLAENAPARRFYETMGGTLDAGVEKVFTREGARLLEVRYRFRCE